MTPVLSIPDLNVPDVNFHDLTCLFPRCSFLIWPNLTWPFLSLPDLTNTYPQCVLQIPSRHLPDTLQTPLRQLSRNLRHPADNYPASSRKSRCNQKPLKYSTYQVIHRVGRLYHLHYDAPCLQEIKSSWVQCFSTSGHHSSRSAGNDVSGH